MNKSDFDLRVEGNSTTGFYTARDNIWVGSDSRIVGAIFGTYQGH